MGDLVKIGALWLKDGKKGKFMGGKVKIGETETALLIFKNNRKAEGSRQPDYEIFLAGERPPAKEEDEPFA